jgi:mannosyltransferase OCH1-like enzyme
MAETCNFFVGLHPCIVGFLSIAFGIFMYWAVFAGTTGIGVISVYLTGYSSADYLTSRDLDEGNKLVTTVANRSDALDVDFNFAEYNLKVSHDLLTIPKIIHRTWKTSNLSTMPAGWASGYKSCKALHPTWTTIVWSDESARELIRRHYDWFLPEFDSYRFPIQRADALRYFVLYHYGGVYLDMDMGCRTQLDPLVEGAPRGSAIFPNTWPVGVSNGLMLATQRHPFMWRLIRNLHNANRWYACDYLTVIMSTGPLFVTLNYHYAPPAERRGVRILSWDLYTGGSAFFYHLHGSSWHGTDAEIVKYMVSQVEDIFVHSLTQYVAWMLWIGAVIGVWLLSRKPPCRRLWMRLTTSKSQTMKMPV